MTTEASKSHFLLGQQEDQRQITRRNRNARSMNPHPPMKASCAPQYTENHTPNHPVQDPIESSKEFQTLQRREKPSRTLGLGEGGLILGSLLVLGGEDVEPKLILPFDKKLNTTTSGSDDASLTRMGVCNSKGAVRGEDDGPENETNDENEDIGHEARRSRQQSQELPPTEITTTALSPRKLQQTKGRLSTDNEWAETVAMVREDPNIMSEEEASTWESSDEELSEVDNDDGFQHEANNHSNLRAHFNSRKTTGKRMVPSRSVGSRRSHGTSSYEEITVSSGDSHDNRGDDGRSAAHDDGNFNRDDDFDSNFNAFGDMADDHDNDQIQQQTRRHGGVSKSADAGKINAEGSSAGMALIRQRDENDVFSTEERKVEDRLPIDAVEDQSAGLATSSYEEITIDEDDSYMEITVSGSSCDTGPNAWSTHVYEESVGFDPFQQHELDDVNDTSLSNSMLLISETLAVGSTMAPQKPSQGSLNQEFHEVNMLAESGSSRFFQSFAFDGIAEETSSQLESSVSSTSNASQKKKRLVGQSTPESNYTAPNAFQASIASLDERQLVERLGLPMHDSKILPLAESETSTQAELASDMKPEESGDVESKPTKLKKKKTIAKHKKKKRGGQQKISGDDCPETQEVDSKIEEEHDVETKPTKSKKKAMKKEKKKGKKRGGQQKLAGDPLTVTPKLDDGSDVAPKPIKQKAKKTIKKDKKKKNGGQHSIEENQKLYAKLESDRSSFTGLEIVANDDFDASVSPITLRGFKGNAKRKIKQKAEEEAKIPAQVLLDQVLTEIGIPEFPSRPQQPPSPSTTTDNYGRIVQEAGTSTEQNVKGDQAKLTANDEGASNKVAASAKNDRIIVKKEPGDVVVEKSTTVKVEDDKLDAIDVKLAKKTSGKNESTKGHKNVSDHDESTANNRSELRTRRKKPEKKKTFLTDDLGANANDVGKIQKTKKKKAEADKKKKRKQTSKKSREIPAAMIMMCCLAIMTYRVNGMSPRWRPLPQVHRLQASAHRVGLQSLNEGAHRRTYCCFYIMFCLGVIVHRVKGLSPTAMWRHLPQVRQLQTLTPRAHRLCRAGSKDHCYSWRRRMRMHGHDTSSMVFQSTSGSAPSTTSYTNEAFTETKRQFEQACELYEKNMVAAPQNVDQILQDLEREAAEPTFWDASHKERNSYVTSQISYYSRLKSRMDQWKSYKEDCEIATEMLETPSSSSSTTAQDQQQSLFSDEERLSLLEEFQTSTLALVDDLERFQLELLLSGSYDDQPCRLVLTAGAGGTEATDWVADLKRMYERHAEKMGFAVAVEDSQPGDVVGYKSVDMVISGGPGHPYGWFKGEKGAHRLVRLSPFNANNKRQTTFAGVDVAPILMDGDLSDIEIPDKDLEITTMRSGGAGGQNVNKVNSAVRIKHIPSGLNVKCTQERSQSVNKDLALKRLKAQLLAIAKEQQVQEIQQIRGDQVEASWGAQVRNYVLHPYKMVKDQRSGWETSDAQGFLDGDLEECIAALLRHQSQEQLEAIGQETSST